MHLKPSFIALLCVATFAKGQDKNVRELQRTGTRVAKEDTSHKSGWKRGAQLTLGLAQGATRNWAAGGERSSLAVNGYANLFADYRRGAQRWYNNLDLFYAVLRTTTQGTRKNDDRIDLFSKFSHNLGKKFGFGAVGNLRTQFTNGYDYAQKPPERISAFLAPAYLTIAPGFDWSPVEGFGVFGSPLSTRWTYSGIRTLAPFYGIVDGRRVRTEAGAYLSATLKREVLKNVTWQARMDLYSNYLAKPGNIDVFWTNVVAMKVNRFLSVTYNFDLVYDDDIRIFGPSENAPRTQSKSLLSVGITLKR